MTFACPIARSTGTPLENLLPDIEQHAVAQFDGVIQAQQGDRRAVADEKYSNMRSRPSADCAYSPTGPTGSVSVGAALRHRHERIYVARRKRDNSRVRGSASATMPGRNVFIAQVSPSVPGGSEFAGGHDR